MRCLRLLVRIGESQEALSSGPPGTGSLYSVMWASLRSVSDNLNRLIRIAHSRKRVPKGVASSTPRITWGSATPTARG